MNKLHSLTLAAVLSASLAGCSEPPSPPSPPDPPAPPIAKPNSDQSFIGRHVSKAIDQARKELATENIDVGGINININGRKISSGKDGLPKAEISPQGDFLVEGKAVDITPAQRQALLAYRGQIIGVAEAGMAIGAQGADIAGEAIGGVIGAIFGGKDGEDALEKRVEAKAKDIEAEALKLCNLLPGLLAGQQSLAASLPAFAPYAQMTQADIDDCGKKGKDTGISVTGA